MIPRWRVRGLSEQREGTADVVRTLRRRVEEHVAAGADLAKIDAELARFDVQRTRVQVELEQARSRLTVRLRAIEPIDAAELVEARAARRATAAAGVD